MTSLSHSEAVVAVGRAALRAVCELAEVDPIRGSPLFLCKTPLE